VAASLMRTMPKRIAIWLGAAAFAVAGALAPAQAQTKYDRPPGDTLYPLPEVSGAVPWELLVNVDMVYEGVDLVPEYSDEVRALVGETVKMVGFLVPLDAARTHVLLSMISPNCPYCLPGGPETFVELIADEPIEYSNDAVVVTGRFELLHDSLAGYYYRMTEVARAAADSS